MTTVRHTPGLVFVTALLASTTLACDDGSSDGATQGLGTVQVTVTGSVVAADSQEAVAGISVAIVRDVGEDAAEVVLDLGLTDEAGRFNTGDAPLRASIQPDEYRYFLQVSDPDGRYQTNASTVVFAVVTSTLAFDDILLTPLEPQARTAVVGTVVDGLTDMALPGVQVTLTPIGAEGAPASAETGMDGRFEIADVVVASYRLELDGQEVTTDLAPEGYIPEDRRVDLGNDIAHDLGTLRLAPSSPQDNLTLILSWNYVGPEVAPFFRPHDLDLALSLADEDFNLNQLAGAGVELNTSNITVSPASGFGTRTAYWPAFLGGTDEGRVEVDDELDVYEVGEPARLVAAHLGDNVDGQSPEALVFFQENPMAEFPTDLAYYYAYGEDETHYPVGVAAVTVTNSSLAEDGQNENIHESLAVVKAYVGRTFVGRFELGPASLPPGEPSVRSWTPMIVEYGFTSEDPVDNDEVYFRVLPFSALDVTQSADRWPYEVQSARETGLQSARRAFVFEDELYVAGSTGEETEDAHGLWTLFADPLDGGAREWERLPADDFPHDIRIEAFGVFLGDLQLGGRGPDATGVFNYFAPDEVYPCADPQALQTAGGTFLIGGPDGLQHATIVEGDDGEDVWACGDDHPTLVGAPEVPITALFTHRFYEGERMLLGGEGVGLRASPIPEPGSDVTEADWDAPLPGGGTFPPADSTVTAMTRFLGALVVGTEGSGVFWAEQMEDDDGEPRTVWSSLPSFPPDGLETMPRVNGFATLDGRLFIATDQWVVEFDPTETPETRFVGFLEGDFEASDIVAYGADLYVLSDNGVLVLR